jgi:hypothetical protein
VAVVESSGTQTAVISTEHTLASPSTAKTRMLIVDGANLTAAETVELRIKAPVLSGGTVSLVKLVIFTGVLDEPHIQSPPIVMPQGGTFTLKQTAGTGRAFAWSIITLD